MKERTYTIRGVVPIVMHNEQLSDPLNKWAKLVREISKKRQKTEEDLIEMSRREWFGGLYYTAELGPYIPERCLEKMLREAAAKSKRGKDVLSGLIVTSPAPLQYKGPRDADSLWESESFLLRASVGVGQQRVIRSRPMFPDWSMTFVVNIDEGVLEASDVDGFVVLAGQRIGLGDWRPKHGRFTLESKK